MVVTLPGGRHKKRFFGGKKARFFYLLLLLYYLFCLVVKIWQNILIIITHLSNTLRVQVEVITDDESDLRGLEVPWSQHDILLLLCHYDRLSS